MKLRPLLRSLILPIAALLALAAPPSRAAVEIITFGTETDSMPRDVDKRISTDSVPSIPITLSNGDTVTVGITSWGSYTTQKANLKWNEPIPSVISSDLGISLSDFTANFCLPCRFTYASAGDNMNQKLSLNLSKSHQAGDQIVIYILVNINTLSSWTTVPYDIGLTGSLESGSLFYARDSHFEFYEATEDKKIAASLNAAMWLQLKGKLKNGCRVDIPLSYNGTPVYAISSIAYSYDVPEPSSSFLALSGLLLLLRRRRRG